MGLEYLLNIFYCDQVHKAHAEHTSICPVASTAVAEQPAAVAWIFILNNANGAGDLSIHQLLIVNTSAGPVKPLFENCQCACTAHYWLETRTAVNHRGVTRRVSGQGRAGGGQRSDRTLLVTEW